MSDPLHDLNKRFAENQKNTETCSIGNHGGCHAPKFDEIPTEAGLPIAVCAYHYVEMMYSEDIQEKKSQELFDVSFDELESAWSKYNSKIKAEGDSQ